MILTLFKPLILTSKTLFFSKTNHTEGQNVVETPKCDQVFEALQNDKVDVTSAWDKVLNTSQKDIRVLFLEAIEDFYSVTGGPR